MINSTEELTKQKANTNLWVNSGIQRASLHSENKFIINLEDGQSKEVFTDEKVLELHRQYKDPGVLLRRMHVSTEAQSLQSCSTLWDPLYCSLPDSSVHGIFQARNWSGLPCLLIGDLLNPGIKLTSLMSLMLACGFFTTSINWEAP